jgi:hypothetical protein
MGYATGHGDTANCSRAAENLRQLCSLLKVDYRVLQLDVATRWWSTHDMLDSILTLQVPLRAVMSLEDDVGNNHNLKIKFEDGWWQVIERAVAVLTPLMKAVKVLEGEKYVTVSWVPWILYEMEFALKSELQSAVGDSSLYECVSRVYMDFRKRFCNRDMIEVPRLVKFAALLDPRTKAWDYMSLPEEEELWADLSAHLMSQFGRARTQKVSEGGVVASAVALNSAAASGSKKSADGSKKFADIFKTTRSTRTTFLSVATYATDEEDHLQMVSGDIINPSTLYYNDVICFVVINYLIV